MRDPTAILAEQLDVAFLRRVRALVNRHCRDLSGADRDDVTQDTLAALAATLQRETEIKAPYAWLVSVIRKRRSRVQRSLLRARSIIGHAKRALDSRPDVRNFCADPWRAAEEQERRSP